MAAVTLTDAITCAKSYERLAASLRLSSSVAIEITMDETTLSFARRSNSQQDTCGRIASVGGVSNFGRGGLDAQRRMRPRASVRCGNNHRIRAVRRNFSARKQYITPEGTESVQWRTNDTEKLQAVGQVKEA
jgi:hypothetical protein